jgi:predicted TPR repeat methyltransferase
MAETIPDRIKWAVDILEVAPTDHILEIGCGHGLAVSLISSKLVDGTITAIDQSEKMIRMARNKNVDHETKGKARFVSGLFHEADLGQRRFNKIFAVNVNIFWMKGDLELHIFKQWLQAGGTVYLFNQPPDADKLQLIAEHTSQNLRSAGLEIKQIITGKQKPVPVLCVIAES